MRQLQNLEYNGSARETNAAITRAQWADYKARFQPLEMELQGGLTFDPVTGAQNTEMINKNIARGQDSVTGSFDAQTASNARNMQRIGVSPTEEQQSSIQRASAITRAAASVDAENMTRGRLADRNQEIALGSVTSSGRSY